MKNRFVVIIIFLMLVTFFAQENSVERKLESLKSSKDVKVTEVEKDIIKIEYPSGKTKIKNVGEYLQTETTLNKLAAFATTEIDLTTIDTTLYHDKYKFWKEVNISTWGNEIIIADINKNGLAELYGVQKDYYSNYSDLVIIELTNQGTFNKIFSYDSTLDIKSIYDVDKDGKEEISLLRLATDIQPPDTNDYKSWLQYLYYKQPTDTSLAKDFSFLFEPRTNWSQQEDHRYGDWDGDNNTDMILNYIEQGINIFEYNPASNNFDSVYYYDFDPLNFYYRGFAEGDFDEDGRVEFFAGSIQGKIIGIENRGDNDYKLSWEGMVETYNAYLFTQTNDLDGNGKKEIWAGGDATYDGVGKTRITLFEANGDNSYAAVGRIDLVGVFSFWAGNLQTIDVDKDGKEEVLVCIDGNVLILKFNGSRNKQTYEVFYIKQDHLFYSGRNTVYYGAVMYDFNCDGKEDIVINMHESNGAFPQSTIRLFSLLYKPDFTVDVKEVDETIPTEFCLYQNYPNPFNPSTTISYSLPAKSFVIIKVYNMLGEEVKSIVEEEKEAGRYEEVFNAIHLPSGVYIISMIAGGYSKSIKAVLLK